MNNNFTIVRRCLFFDKKGNITYHHRRFIPGDEVELFAEIKKASQVK